MGDYYARADDCRFFKPDSKALAPYPLPMDDISFERTGRLLRIEHGHRLYYLGIAPGGQLVGFRGMPARGMTADLVILKVGLFDFRIYQSRFFNEEQLEAELKQFDGKLDAGAYSCGQDYGRNVEFKLPMAHPSEIPPSALVSDFHSIPLYSATPHQTLTHSFAPIVSGRPF